VASESGPWRIAVLGAGAMGTLFGARLARVGHEVTMIDVSPELLAAVSVRGLRLEDDEGDHRLRVAVGLAGDFSESVDLLIVFTKSIHTRAAIEAARHLVGPQSIALTLQNGLGNVETVEQVLPRSRIVHGMTNFPVDLVGLGHASSHGPGEARLYAADGIYRSEVEILARVLDGAGLTCRVDDKVEASIWEKVAFNAALNAIAALTRLTVGSIGSAAAGVQLAHAAADEVVDVALARRVPAERARVHESLAHAFAHHAGHKPSMLQDVLAGRPTEVDNINGAIITLGAQVSVPVPVNWTLHRLVTLLHPRQG